MAPKYDRLIEHDEDHGSSSTVQEPTLVMPETYYEDGPFDAPSSDDEEDETLLEKPSSPGFAEQGGLRNTPKSTLRSASLRALVISLAALVGLAVFIGLIAAHTYKGISFRLPGAKRITMNNTFDGTFSPNRNNLHWVPEAGDGVFSIFNGGVLDLVDLKTNTTRSLLDTADIKDENGARLFWQHWQLSPDMKYILVKANLVQQWRHSSFGNYYVHDLETKQTRPLVAPSHPPTTAFATWSPTGESIAFVQSNDLYVLVSPSSPDPPIRITTSGSSSVFNGVPDWVYEEEVFSSNSALWWSPDSTKVAFLRLDESDVPTYSFPVYNPGEDATSVVPYTANMTMRYPKPGYNNPLVSVHVFDLAVYREETVYREGSGKDETLARALWELEWEGRRGVEDRVVMEVAWIGGGTVLVKEVGRAATQGSVVFFDLDAGREEGGKKMGRVVRRLGKEGEEGDEGWIDQAQNIRSLPSHLTHPSENKNANSNSNSNAYLDIVPSPEGYNHIALFTPASSSVPRFLTSGEWEVTGSIGTVDVEKGLVYFQAARPTSTVRHIYSVPIPRNLSSLSSHLSSLSSRAPTLPKVEEPVALTDTSESALYAADFSPGAGFYLLSYGGPGVPWQRVVKVGDKNFNYVLTDNKALNATLAAYEAPIVTYSTIDSEGFELNVKEVRPPRMDDSGRTKYAVLFHVYGGPSSQLVDVRYDHDWHHYLACGLHYIVVTVDGRGTGFKGRKLRNVVKGNLGFWETRDQVNAARIWAAKEYVDPKRIGIWGWSYGGFMSAKVVEADAGIHSLAMSVAPVTSWRLYDSIYTERYMDLPRLNPGGYVNASISNVTGFHNLDYLLAHGSGDDNVHFANSAHLLDMLTSARVRGFRFRMFTDSDHSISRRGAYRELYEYLTGFLVEKWGKGGRRRGW